MRRLAVEKPCRGLGQIGKIAFQSRHHPQTELAGGVEERGRSELSVGDHIRGEASADAGRGSLEQALPGRVFAVSGPVGFHIQGKSDARPDHGEQGEVGPVAMDGPLAVFDGTAQPARFLLGVAGTGAVQNQSDQTSTLEDLVALGVMDGRAERGARGFRIETLGGIGQGVIAKRRPDTESGPGRGRHQPFHAEETPGAQQVGDEQRPDPSRRRDARPNPAVAGVLEIGLQPQAIGSVVQDLHGAGLAHRGCCFRHSTRSSALAANTSLRAS